MTTTDIELYVGALFLAFIVGYVIGIKIRAFRDFTNSI